METPACPPSGKRVKGNLYFHVCVLEALDTLLRERVQLATTQAGLSPYTDFNVIKIDAAGQRISLLSYAHFFDHPFPALQSAAVVNLASGRVKRINYDPAQNPPILHRKELLLPPDHPQVPMFAALTRQLEAAGLFRDARRIGFTREWQARLLSAGYEVRDHQLVPLNDATQSASSSTEPSSTETLARHRTALQRYALSTPMQALHRHGYLDGTRIVFDYGCGKGDDVRILHVDGVEARGWDPHFAPDTPKTAADIVNLGFVINVIEDLAERTQALRDAYHLARQLLSVSRFDIDNGRDRKSVV